MKDYRDLRVYIQRDTRSVELMDKFEGYGTNNQQPYDRLVLTNKHYGLSKDRKWFSYSLVVERKPKNNTPIGDITFTEFKQGKIHSLEKHVEESITGDIIDRYSGKKETFHFDECYRLRAQNSLNRTGYGWTWDWRNGYGDYIEGTYYGETTEYMFSGIYIH